MADFAKCASMTLQYEGVSSNANYIENNGYAEKYGVTIDLAKKAGDMDIFDKNGDGKITPKDIRKLDFDDAILAYKKVYWDCWNLETLDDQKAALIFDASMNHGHRIAAKIVQKTLIALGFDDVIADGIYGPHTREAIADVSTEKFAEKYFAVRLSYYEALAEAYPNEAVHLDAWKERLETLKDFISGL